MAKRHDLNGQLWTKPDNTEPWFLIDRGERRGIPPNAFGKFLVNEGQLIAKNEVDQIDRGADFPNDIGLVGCTENGAIFLREGNVLRGIPPGEVFKQYHFNQQAMVMWPLAQILQHPGGPLIEPPTPSSNGPVRQVTDDSDEMQALILWLLAIREGLVAAYQNWKIKGGTGSKDLSPGDNGYGDLFVCNEYPCMLSLWENSDLTSIVAYMGVSALQTAWSNYEQIVDNGARRCVATAWQQGNRRRCLYVFYGEPNAS